MSLTPGTRLRAYDVLAKLVEGGMGEVYRGRDNALQRDVALKVLPAAFLTDPDRLMRFRREAQLLAALNHPNIAAIYGSGGAGRLAGVPGRRRTALYNLDPFVADYDVAGDSRFLSVRSEEAPRSTSC